jgi:2-polyprenyl-3-methyl-5-hydroxy-6-metoxy-1,4-benzoquinol methylase
MKNYKYDSEELIYYRSDKKGIGYADGGESYLNKIMESEIDLSTFSDELQHYMKDWPSEYHLSRKRHLLLKPFNIMPNDSVLELGCGCGAITRYLAEIGAQVTAVEGEPSRATVTSKRCKDFSNVKVISDNLLDVNFNKQFDWVLLIGVFEYSQKYGKTDNKQKEYLDVVKKHLKPNGSLIIAIENKIGVKYINGASEDHNSKMYYGIQDLYSSNDVTTYGRAELSDILSSSGFSNSKFYGVFPDYKLPKAILSEEISYYTNFRAEELMLYVKSLDYSGHNHRAFDESLFLKSLRKNKLLIDMSNSFLVEARLDEPFTNTSEKEKTLAYYFSTDRHSKYCTNTIFIKNQNGSLSVLKNGNTSSFSITGIQGENYVIQQTIPVTESLYYDGILLATAFTSAIAKQSIEEANDILQIWADFLFNNFKFYDQDTGLEINKSQLAGKNLSSILIEGSALDCGPQNIIMNNSELKSFDLEWVSQQPVPLAWVLHRNTNHILRDGYIQKQLLTALNVVGLICEKNNITATIQDIEKVSGLEGQLQKIVSLPTPTNRWQLIEK